MKEKPTVGSKFFGSFPSDRIPKATKDVNVISFNKIGLISQKHLLLFYLMYYSGDMFRLSI